jgi:hypothetical protein
MRGDDRRIPHQGGHRGRIQRCRHHQKCKVGPQRAAHLKAKRKAKVGVQAAFVEFVEDHQSHPGKFGVGLDHPCQDAFGHHFDPGGG